VIAPSLETLRLFLHVTAACVWVGGQLVLAALVPALRRVSPEAAPAAARQFARVAWPAFGVLVLTGVWNVAEEGVRSGAYRTTLIAKLAAVLVSGVAAYAHGRARNRGTMAWTGALTGLAALVALLLGIVLAG
jgi:putative copper export protein